jgi:hypothetical protein
MEEPRWMQVRRNDERSRHISGRSEGERSVGKMMTVFFIGPCVLAKKPAAFFYSGRETEHLISARLYSVAKKRSKKKHDCEALVCVPGSDAFFPQGGTSYAEGVC